VDTAYRRVQNRCRTVLQHAKHGDKGSRYVDYFLATLVIINIVAIALESVASIYERFGVYFDAIEAVSISIFTVEYVLRIWSAPLPISSAPNFAVRLKQRWAYITSFNGLIDLVSILPFYIQAIFPYVDLRILRAFRLLRILKLSNYNSALEDLFEAIMEERRSFYAALYLFIIVFIVSSSLMYFAEHRVHPDGFKSIPGSMYWSLITLTTVGYGDITPVTVAGKIIASTAAVFGVIVVALITGIVVSSFNSQMERRRLIFEDQVRSFLLDGILDNNEERALEALRKEFGMSKRRADELVEQVRATKAHGT
jgi:voltage-gated potassium channel